MPDWFKPDRKARVTQTTTLYKCNEQKKKKKKHLGMRHTSNLEADALQKQKTTTGPFWWNETGNLCYNGHRDWTD